jgi:AraC family transcriptional regulator
MDPKALDVYNVLLESGEKSGRSVDLGNGLSLSHWKNSNGYAVYENPEHHTLSLYLRGGKETRRHDGERMLGKGYPGAICMMPADVKSEWSISGAFEFMHLYFSKDTFKRLIEAAFVKDPSSIEINDIYFQSDVMVQRICHDIMLPIDWKNPMDRFSLSNASQLLLQHIFRHYTNQNLAIKTHTGGLSPYIMHRIKDFIEASLEKSFTVDDLASIANLSSFHFSRMFGLSEGKSPHQYVLSRRIENAKHLFGEGKKPLVEIAQHCGFSSQSHLTSRFRTLTGMTPNQFRKLS